MDSQYFSCHSRDNRIAVSPNQKPEYHHDRHLVLFALLDWFLIPGQCAVSNTFYAKPLTRDQV